MNAPPPERRGATPVFWALLGAAGLCATCGLLSVAVVALGVAQGPLADAEEPAAVSVAGAGEPGEIGFVVPSEFKPVSDGRFRYELRDGDARHSVDVIKLAAVPGLAEPERKLEETWRTAVAPDWPGAPTQLLPLRRFVSNGARAYFTAARMTAPGHQHPSLVSLYLVESDDRLEPFVVLQAYEDRSVGAMLVAAGSFDRTQPAVEVLFEGIGGSPVGLPLVDASEVVGTWTAASGASQEVVHVLTGASAVNAVSWSSRYQLEPGGRFSWTSSGATTRLGNTQFGSDRDTGRWTLKHDLLVLDGEARDKSFFIVGAGRGPSGKRVLYLLPEGHWSLSPSVIAQHGQLYEAAD